VKDMRKTKKQLIDEMKDLRARIVELEGLEAEPQESEKNYRNLVDNALVGIFKSSIEGEILYVNDALVSMLEYDSAEELRSIRVLDTYEDPEEREALLADLREKGKEVGREIRLLTKTGKVKNVLVSEVLEQDILSGMMMDITERKKTADALQRTIERYRTLFDDSPISLWEEDYSEVKQYIEQLRNEGVTDFRGYFERNPEAVEQCAAMVQIVDVNQATLDVYEAKSKEDFIEGLGRIFTERSYEVFREGLIAIAEGKSFFESEAVNRTLEGTRKDIQIRWSIPRAYERTLARLLVSIVDVTDRNRMEQELGNIQRLQALGVLAGGIAHDFNNILTAILANISMARLYGEFDDEISQMLVDAEKASLRAKGLTQQLLTFAKGGEPIKKIVRISRFLQESAAFALSGSNTRCEYSMPDDLWLVSADEGQLSQVVQNLVINADQAMPEGGVVTIRAENMRIKENERGKLEEGKYVKLSVEDQGSGIPEEQLPKIFDPFFTTKERGRGLGLAIAFSIVNRHGGHMEVESALGGGTAFHVYLPTSETSAEPREGVQVEPTRGEGRVLVVDDEAIVRRSAGEVLKRLGYEVGFAKDGSEGLDLYEKAMKEERPFDVVIMDLTIPGELGGKRLVRKLRGLDPDAKVIVSSGYSDDPVMSQFKEYGFDGVLVKPYKVADLAAVIRKVLSEG